VKNDSSRQAAKDSNAKFKMQNMQRKTKNGSAKQEIGSYEARK
jgi:hypothetical protein